MLDIVNFSGGKDSTFLLLYMIENNYKIDEVIHCDSGKEFPAMYKHIDDIQSMCIDKGIKFTILKAEKSFEDIMIETEGWADFQFRRCTGVLKRDLTASYLKGKKYILHIGFAADETYRKKQKKQRYIMQEIGITEQQALEYCYSKGYFWEGLYEKFHRVSCFCCPLQRINALKTIYSEFPNLWNQIKELDKLSKRDFRTDYTLQQLEAKFDKEIEIEKQQNQMVGINSMTSCFDSHNVMHMPRDTRNLRLRSPS